MLTLDLAELRKRAGLTQEALAKRIGTTQVQICRMEADPSSIPLGQAFNVLAALGAQLPGSLVRTHDSSSGQIKLGTPYATLARNLRLLEEYLASAPASSEDVEIWNSTGAVLQNLIRTLGRKPNVALLGAFDSGKSRLANSLLGADSLPTAYQPTTRLVTVVRHISDRPSWFKEEVWIMGKGFDPLQADIESHCREHRLFAGTIEALDHFGTHDGKHNDEKEAFSAVVYVDAPVLSACNIIDLPGYDDTDSDNERAETVKYLIDVLLYLSPSTGFLKGPDFIRLSYLLRLLPAPEKMDPSFPTLGNLLIIATRADSAISDQDLQHLLNRGCQRLYAHLGETVLRERGQEAVRTITQDTLRARFFSFWYELPERRHGLEQDLTRLLEQDLPRVRRRNVDLEVKKFKEYAREYLSDRITAYQRMVDNIAETERRLENLLENEASRKKLVRQYQKKILQNIDDYSAECSETFDAAFEKLTSLENVEKLIRASYEEKAEAKEYALGLVLEAIQARLSKILEPPSRKLKNDIDEFLGLYEGVAFSVTKPDGTGTIRLPFNAKGAFLGGLASAAGVGALAIWAVTLGNLGQYILVAKAAGLLATLGINISGGTAGLIALVAAIGGPITIALGILAFGVLLGMILLGDSWQTRLAKGIRKGLADAKAKAKYLKAIDKYWAETRDAFVNSAKAVEAEFLEYLEGLKQVVQDPTQTKATLESRLKSLEETRAYFEGTPWLPLEPSQARLDPNRENTFIT